MPLSGTEACLLEQSLRESFPDSQCRQLTELSGGQLQRVLLAWTLARELEIILPDESTDHLVLKHQTELVTYFKNW